MSPLPDPLLALAERQLGLVARSQALRWGTVGEIDGLVRRGRLVPVERGVYRVPGGAVLAQQPAFAAQLRVGPPAMVTGPVVLGHLEVDGFRGEDRFELLVPTGRRLRLEGSQLRAVPDLDRWPCGRCGEVRVASPLDALIDAARWRAELGDRALRLAYDWCRWNGLISADRFERTLRSRMDSDVGAATMMDVLEGQLRPESEGERLLLPLLRCFDPSPEVQVVVAPMRRVDLYFRAVRTGIEYHGSTDHAALARQLADDERDRELRAAGIRLLYVTDADLRDPAAVVATVAGFLATRALELGVPAPTVRPAVVSERAAADPGP